MSRLRGLVLALSLTPLGLTTMCGGGASPAPPAKSPEEAAHEAKSRELEALENDRPKTPYVLDRTRAFRAARECGQGPFRAEVSGLGAKYGERVDVYACGPRGLAGRVRVSADAYGDSTGDGLAFGYFGAENARCKASDAEIARLSDAGSSGAASPSHPSGHAAKAAAAKPAESEQLREEPSVSLNEGKCPAGASYQYLASTEYRSPSPLQGKIHVEIWSAEPNDLRDVMFVVQQLRVDPSMTDAAWDKLQKDKDAWYARFDAFAKSHDDMFIHDEDAGFAPPPPPKAETQPPKPSVHAEWVPGYYHRNGTAWAWIPGWWRVPDADVQQKLTVVAPTAPPPPRDEPSAREEVAPAPEAVWAPGQWQWDGARWVWVTGAWRLPPRQGMAWQAPRWRSEDRGFVFVPGGWSVRVR